MHHITAIIIKQNGKQSTGKKGFSPNELKEAGVNKQQAKQIGIRVDVKRKSTHQANVDCLKVHIKPKS
jgi:large subunit ribosomal protein L13e